MPAPRMTIRRLMVAVAIVSLLLALVVRHERLHRIATYHVDQAATNHDPVPLKRGDPPAIYSTSNNSGPNGVRTSFRLTPRGVWHLKMSDSYEKSAFNNTLLLGTALTLSGILCLITLIGHRNRKRLQNVVSSRERAPGLD